MEVSFSCTAGAFLYRYLCSSSDIEACFIKYIASGVPHFGPFIKIMINALRASLFNVLLLLFLIRLIVLPPRSGHALLTGVINSNLTIEVIIGNSLMLLAPQICLYNHSVAFISGFSLFRDRFLFNWNHFFLIEIS